MARRIIYSNSMVFAHSILGIIYSYRKNLIGIPYLQATTLCLNNEFRPYYNLQITYYASYGISILSSLGAITIILSKWQYYYLVTNRPRKRLIYLVFASLRKTIFLGDEHEISGSGGVLQGLHFLLKSFVLRKKLRRS